MCIEHSTFIVRLSVDHYVWNKEKLRQCKQYKNNVLCAEAV